jgi:hypothetical protein
MHHLAILCYATGRSIPFLFTKKEWLDTYMYNGGMLDMFNGEYEYNRDCGSH